MTIAFTLTVGFVSLVIGYYWGKEAQRENAYREDPDNDPGLTGDEDALLLLTKKERYNLGRAMALGNKQEIKRAKEELERAISHIKLIAFEAKMEQLKKK